MPSEKFCRLTSKWIVNCPTESRYMKVLMFWKGVEYENLCMELVMPVFRWLQWSYAENAIAVCKVVTFDVCKKVKF